MKKPSDATLIGWDIGGAHVKAARIDGGRVSGVVQVAEHLGAESFVYMDVGGHDFTVKASSDVDVATGQEYSVGIPAESLGQLKTSTRVW